MTRALIVVDEQNDFCEGGSLPVQGGLAVVDKTAGYIASLTETLIVFTKDAHLPDSDNGGHIAIPPTEPDYVDVWPAHCIQGTEGFAYAPHLIEAQSGLSLPYIEVFKGQGVPAYSGFQGTTQAGKSLTDLLLEQGVERVDVIGLAADYCVRATALDSIAAGFDTRVLAKFTASINTPVEDVVAEIHAANEKARA